MDMTAENWLSNVNKCRSEASTLIDKQTALKLEALDLNNHIYYSYNSANDTCLGIFVIVAAGIIALAVYFVAKRRDIAAFSMQQTMPLAQEGIEKMTPTIAKSSGTIAGTVAKEIASGIKEGLKEEPDNTNTENKQ